MSTKPTLETLLERINDLGNRLFAELAESRVEMRTSVAELRAGQEELRKGQEELRKGQEELRKDQEQLRADMNAGFRKVERKMEILNDSLLEIKAQLRDHEYRLEHLESKLPVTT